MSGPDDAPREATDEPDDYASIARRAYEISQSEEAGTAEENWRRAEREIHERREEGARQDQGRE